MFNPVFNVQIGQLGVPSNTGRVYDRSAVALMHQRAESVDTPLYGETVATYEGWSAERTPIIDLVSVSHVVKRVWVGDDDKIFACIRTTHSPHGWELARRFHVGEDMVFKPRGIVRNGHKSINDRGELVVSAENFTFVTIDALPANQDPLC